MYYVLPSKVFKKHTVGHIYMQVIAHLKLMPLRVLNQTYPVSCQIFAVGNQF